MREKHVLWHENYPLASGYAPEWVFANQMGPNALWLMEWLVRAMDLQPGMRVLDMGCGRAMTSVFLAREFDVQVWANDLWIAANDNWQTVCAAGVADRVFPMHAEAHALPYAAEFFDAIVSVDSYHYFGAADLYLDYFVRFVKKGGQIGIAVPGAMQSFDGGIPEHLNGLFGASNHELYTFHTASWWRHLWGRTPHLDVEVADVLEDGWKDWLRFNRARLDHRDGNEWDMRDGCGEEVEYLEVDRGRYLGFARLVGRRTS